MTALSVYPSDDQEERRAGARYISSSSAVLQSIGDAYASSSVVRGIISFATPAYESVRAHRPDVIFLVAPGLKVPVPIEHVDGDGQVFVTHPDTGIFGVGRDLKGAVEDLVLALHEHRDVLRSSQNLSAGLKDQLSRIDQLIAASSD